KKSALGSMVIQEFGRAFVLAHTNMAVIRGNRHDAIIPNLMNVLSRSKNARVDLSLCFRIVHLITRVAKGRKPELILNPFAEIAGAVRLLSGKRRLVLCRERPYFRK